MPQNALVASYDAIEMGVGGSFSLPSSPYATGDFFASFEALYAPNAVDLAVSVAVEIGATTDGGGSWHATYDGPNAPSGGYSAGGSGLPSELSLYARFLGVRLYSRFASADIRFTWTGIEIRINGSLAATLGGGSWDSAGMGPLYVAPHSGLAAISGGAGVSIDEAALRQADQNPDGSFSSALTAEAGGTVNGGYRYMVGGQWKDLPVTLPPASAEPPLSGIGHNGPGGVGGTVTAPYGLSLPQTVTATRTWGSQIVSRHRIEYRASQGPSGSPDYSRYVLADTSGGSLTVVPDPPRAIDRINPDFLASVWHWASPLVIGRAVRGIDRPDVSPPDSTETSVSPELYAHRDAGAEELGNAAGIADAMCAIRAYSCVDANAGRNLYDRGFAGGSGWMRDKGENVRYQHPNFDSQSSVEPGTTPYMGHATALGRYYASAIPHPFWSLGYVPGNWEAQGGAVRWARTLEDPDSPAYWGYVREQFLAAQGRRNHVVSCPLEVSGWQQFLDAYNRTSPETSGKRWLGISRWLTQEVAPPPSVATGAGSSAAWSAVDSSCSLSFGPSGIVLTGTAGALCAVRLDVGRFDAHPYLYPMVCDRVRLGWEASGVESVRAWAATTFGDRKEIAPLSSGVVARIPRGSSSKYAGSWGYDDGAGAVADQGSDSLPSGVSSSLGYDPENSLMYRLLEAGSPGLIEIEVRLAAGSTSATLHWPEWFRAEGSRRLEAESGMVQSLIHADGPGVRVGNQTWYVDGIGLVNPPLTRGLGEKWHLVDWLCFKRLALLAEPFAGGTPDLTTELAAIFDAYEVRSVGAAAFGTLAFVLPSDGPEWRVACVHAVGEIPPLAAYPSFSRLADWSKGAWGNAGVWAWAQGPRRIVAGGSSPMHLARPDGTVVTAAVSAPSGWSVTEHSAVVTNSETADWRLLVGTTEWAKATPWHGWFWSGGAPTVGGYVALSTSRSAIHVWARPADDGTLVLSRADNARPGNYAETYAKPIVADALRLDHEGGGGLDPLVLAYSKDGSCFLARCELSGVPEAALDLGPGTQAVSRRSANGLRFVWRRLSSGGIVCDLFDLRRNLISTRTTNLSGFDDKPIDATVWALDGKLLIELTGIKAGVATLFVSEDGVTFA